MDKMESGKMSQKEYLRKYLSDKDDGAAKRKKKKKLKVGPKTVKIIDDDIDISNMRPLEDGEFRILNTTEDAPQIVGVIDERGPVDFADKRRWRIIADDGEGNVACDSHENYELPERASKSDTERPRSNNENGKHGKRKERSPSRMASSDRDVSSPRTNKRSKSDAKRLKKKQRRDASSSDSSDTNDERKSQPKKAASGRRRDSSPTRKSSESDQSPPRKRKNDRDVDRAENRGKEKNRGYSDSDQSPQRRRRDDRNIDKDDSDQSPPRRKKNDRNIENEENYGKRKNRGNSDSDKSPPRRRKNDRNVDKDQNSGKRKSRGNSDSDQSPPRRRKNDRPIDTEKSGGKRKNRENSDSDQSPPRRRKNDRNIDDEENYGKGRHRENLDSDQSPPKRRKNDRTVDNEKSSARRKNRENSDSDQSPPRRRKNDRPIDNEKNGEKRKSRRNSDSDLSPPRRSKNDGSAENRSRKSRGSDSDLSPPRAPKNIRPDSKSYRDEGKNGSRNDDQRRRRGDRSPRRSRWNEDDSRNPRDTEPRGKRSEADVEPKMKKTLDGKVAGLQDARALKIENEAHRKREAAMFKKLSAEVSGVGQAAVFRDRKTGRRRDFTAEAAETREKEKRQAEIDDKYAKWGKGLKQVDDQAEKRERDMYEMSKPLARYANDADLDKALREVEREGDTMLAEIKQRRIKEGKSEPARPAYQGSCAPNRFGIRPGHRWDGVDRSNGYEKKWFEARNARTALQEEAYKWSTADM